MQLIILKTDIKTQKGVSYVRGLFDEIHQIKDWNIDRQDVDNVLRLEVSEKLNEPDVIALLAAHGFRCEELPD